MNARVAGAGVVGAVLDAAVTLLLVLVTVGFGDGADDEAADGPLELIVFMSPDASEDQLNLARENLLANSQFLQSPTYCDARCSMIEANSMLADEPAVLELLNEDNIPTSWRALILESIDRSLVLRVAEAFMDGPGVVDAVVGPQR